jgi:hypothetical protein
VPNDFPTCAKEGKHMGNTSSGTNLNKISAISGKISQNIGKCRKKEKNTKILIFFQFFKHLKHQQHQINAFPHKYEKRTDIRCIRCLVISNTSQINTELCLDSKASKYH